MKPPYFRWLCALTFFLVSLAALGTGGRFFPVWRLGYWRLDEHAARLLEEWRRGEELTVRVHLLMRSIEGKNAIVKELVAERVMQEAKILLRRSDWNVSEIAYALGFTEVSHFNNFFKKHVDLSPLKFRND